MPAERSTQDATRRPGVGGPKGARPLWRGLIWYVPLIIFLLWIWQDLVSSKKIRTIPYSEFKEHVARGEVAECHISQDEIVGRIVPKSNPTSPTSTAPKPAPITAAQPATGSNAAPAPSRNPRVGSDSSPGKSAEKPSEYSPQKSTEPSPEQAAEEAPSGPFEFRTVRVDDPELIKQLEAAHVKFTGARSSMFLPFLLSWVVPLLIFAAIWYLLSRRVGMAGQAVMSIGKSKAKLVADRETGVSFDDVAGCDEAKYELQEVVDFLKSPERYRALGATIPKGILLVGPPGTGKTLLARAVAGEAHVPFFSISGSEFVEMFVGVGAARVRDLFEQAKQHAPCIIFIDEIDAIGGQRSVRLGMVNDEREQTLNQLLAEMDGFDPNVGVIILGATNRPDILDRALLRPGRFDRQVVVDAPDVDGREAVLKVHARNKRLAADVSLRKIAQATAGMSGADLANALNEAALLAARRGGQEITQRDLEDAVEKVVAGPERKSRRLEPEQKRRVAYHEVGHALVAAYSRHADPVHKISIVPRGRAALGYTLQLPTEEQFLMTRSELFDRIKGMLGGRTSEEIVFGEISTGAENDLERATALARQMVCAFGMSESIGLLHVGLREDGFLPRIPIGPVQRDCSEDTARQIDFEVKRLLEEAHTAAESILTEHRDQLDLVARELLKTETMDGETFNNLIGRPAPVKESSDRQEASVPALS